MDDEPQSDDEVHGVPDTPEAPALPAAQPAAQLAALSATHPHPDESSSAAAVEVQNDATAAHTAPDIDPELKREAEALAKALLEAQPSHHSGKRPATASPDLKPVPKKTSQPPSPRPQLSPIERRSLRFQGNNKKKNKNRH